jgi:hypothetical protein
MSFRLSRLFDADEAEGPLTRSATSVTTFESFTIPDCAVEQRVTGRDSGKPVSGQIPIVGTAVMRGRGPSENTGWRK